MFRLYWKIFLGFWLTGILLATFAIAINQQLSKRQGTEIAGLSPNEIANRTAFILRRLPSESSDWQNRLEENGILLFIRTQNTGSISDSKAPADIEQIFKQLAENSAYEKQSLTKSRIGMRIQSIDDQTVRFVLDMPSLGIFRLRELAGHITAQFALSMLISAFACWVLARYLTRNLAKIGVATRKLAAGNLETRVETEQGFTHDELDSLAIDFNHMATALETSMKNQRRLVRDISHELRSPLARLQLALELARKSQAPEQLDRIEQEASRLNDMIGQLLAMPDGSMPLDDCIDLVSMINDIAEQSAIEANNKDIIFELDLPSREVLVSANATQLHSAIENIVRNAIRYSRKNEILRISLSDSIPRSFAETTQLANNAEHADKTLSDDSASNNYYLLVKDCGPGIPESDLPHIFKPFYRVDEARNRKTGGYGIGLAIVHQVIGAHGGAVSAKNWAQGLEICVKLPSLPQS